MSEHTFHDDPQAYGFLANELRALVTKWRGSSFLFGPSLSSSMRNECADELEAVLSSVKVTGAP